ncbi:MAG: type II toxin-antitoxin system death-on-curing family toxin [Candidatus Dadabacteria bacterium]|nr:MAG: type II toxin-antitoxin system death-on-curing family toxin [Candidatus Dadabacteria bacterium]
MDPTFLSLAEVLAIHQDQVARYGGDPAIRDMGLLQSAVAMPAAGFGGGYVHNDLFEMAAAYLYHIDQNHPFVDGNKRTGAVAAIVFLAMNDVDLEADEREFEQLVIRVAEGDADKSTIAEFLRSNV